MLMSGRGVSVELYLCGARAGWLGKEKMMEWDIPKPVNAIPALLTTISIPS